MVDVGPAGSREVAGSASAELAGRIIFDVDVRQPGLGAGVQKHHQLFEYYQF